MPIKVTCTCGATAMVNDEFAGRTGQCRACKATVTVELATEPAADPPQVPQPSDVMKCGLCGREMSESICQDGEDLCRSCYNKVNVIHEPWPRKFDSLLKIPRLLKLPRPKINPKVIGFIVLLVVFIFGFVIRLEKTRRGPDLYSAVIKGYVTKDNRLVLAGDTHYTVINLKRPINQQDNMETSPVINPTMTNTFSWTGFTKGRPDAKQIQGAAEVAISHDFAYMKFNAAENARREWINYAMSHHGYAVPLAGYNYTLYKSDQDIGNKTSYMLVISGRFSNESNGVKLFYDPGISFRPKFIFNMFQLMLLGPSYLGLCIVMFIATTSQKTASIAGLLTLSMILHGVSSFQMFVMIRIGEAWSGYSSSHNFAIKYAFFGALVLFTIAILPNYFQTPSRNENRG